MATVAELHRFVRKGSPPQDWVPGVSVVRDGWRREPLKMILRPGAVPYLEDGNRRVRYLYLYGDRDMLLPVSFQFSA